jgi:hypothetical protein
MCTIGCMYLEHVDGRWLRQYRYGQRWRWSSVERPEQQQHLLPAATDPEPPAGMPKGQGRRRKEGGIGTAMHAHAGWQGRLHTGKATTYCTAPPGPSQTSQLRVAVGWLPSVTSQGCTPDLAYTFARPRRRLVAAAMRARSACVHYYGSDGAAVQAKPCQRRANRRPPGEDDCEASLVSCAALSALPCLGGRLSGLLSAGLRQHRRASLADAQRDAEFHVAGCRCAVGCGWRGVGSCRDDWKSLERAWGAIT